MSFSSEVFDLYFLGEVLSMPGFIKFSISEQQMITEANRFRYPSHTDQFAVITSECTFSTLGRSATSINHHQQSLKIPSIKSTERSGKKLL